MGVERGVLSLYLKVESISFYRMRRRHFRASTHSMPPLRYATELRMRLASQWLTHERVSIDVLLAVFVMDCRHAQNSHFLGS
ncbi:hypothetical protein CK497_11715 [Vreelandella alkaliphila]|uniref:Uncharacterized protein n=1 Tax=Vreelandella alkaliphila TaxID=272774 RepID=A0ABX4HGR3_9GAMM|nr:hypothetical protein CK497_11715 [Halomonas humidisoli]